MNIANRGRLINFVNGITGVQAGSSAVLNLPVNQRYHRINFQCAAVNYTGGTGLATVALTGAGNDDLTVTPTVVNGVITAVAVVAGGTGYTTGDTITITDATGEGFVGTVTAAAGVVSAVAVTSIGTPTAINPADMLTGLKILVNGVNMRDIEPANILKLAMANGGYTRRGELPVYFTPPWRNVNQQNEVTSWDLFGQSTFQMQIGIASTVTNPSLVAINEFDYMRNVRPEGKNQVPFLQPTAQHQFTWPIVAGRNDINTLPFNFPISRMWLQGSTPGAISQVEVLQDGNKVFEATLEQILQTYGDYGFSFGKPDYINSNWASSAALQSAYNEPAYFDCAFIADPDQRWWKALKSVNSLILRVYSDSAQALTIVQETLPGAYA